MDLALDDSAGFVPIVQLLAICSRDIDPLAHVDWVCSYFELRSKPRGQLWAGIRAIDLEDQELWHFFKEMLATAILAEITVAIVLFDRHFECEEVQAVL